MKVAPVSADLLIKLALAAAGVGLVWYMLKRSKEAVSGAVSDAFTSLGDSVGEVADSVIVGVNPADPGNWINRGVSAAGAAALPDNGPGKNADGSWTVGGWLYDVTHPGWAAQHTEQTGELPVNTGGWTGRW